MHTQLPHNVELVRSPSSFFTAPTLNNTFFVCVPWQLFVGWAWNVFETVGCKPLLSLTEQPRSNVSYNLCVQPSQLSYVLDELFLVCRCFVVVTVKIGSLCSCLVLFHSFFLFHCLDSRVGFIVYHRLCLPFCMIFKMEYISVGHILAAVQQNIYQSA